MKKVKIKSPYSRTWPVFATKKLREKLKKQLAKAIKKALSEKL